MSLPTNCPTGCSEAPPAVEFDNCAPYNRSGQIEYIYIGVPDQSLADWTSSAEWSGRIDNSSSAVSSIRQIRGVFQKPAATDSEQILDGGRRYTGPKEHVITGRSYELNDTNYAALRTLECSPGNYPIWYETRGGGEDSERDLFGGLTGQMAYVKVKHVIPEGEEEVQYLEWEIKWKAKHSPERISSPITH